MELRALQYFLAVADELHFGRAAAKLHMSQPPLSLHIRKLESELGARLFVRSTRSVSLTPVGERFRDNVRRVLRDLEDSVDEIRDFADGVIGHLTVGFVSSANYTVLPGVVPAFKQRCPRVKLSAVPLTSGEQVERLLAGELDLGIVRDESPQMVVTDMDAEAVAGSRGTTGRADGRGLTARIVYEERLVACLPASHPLATCPEVSPEQIARVPMIAYPRELMPGFVDRVAQALGPHAAEARTVERVVHQETALGFVAAGMGTTILPESIRQAVPQSIAVVPLAGSPTTRLLAVTPAKIRQPRLTEELIACLRDAALGSQPLRIAS